MDQNGLAPLEFACIEQCLPRCERRNRNRGGLHVIMVERQDAQRIDALLADIRAVLAAVRAARGSGTLSRNESARCLCAFTSRCRADARTMP